MTALAVGPADGDNDDLESMATPSSSDSDKRAWQLAQAVERDSTESDHALHQSQPTVSPQLLSPPLFVPWSQVASLRGVIAVHKDIEACPHEELKAALDHPLSQLRGRFMPLEHIASQVFQAMYQRQQAEFSWTTLLWTMAQLNEYWIGYDALPLPPVLQISLSFCQHTSKRRRL